MTPPQSSIRANRVLSLFICLIAYLVATSVVFFVLYLWNPSIHLLYITAIADLLGTILIFISSILANNSSMYDPYWSVFPPILILSWLALIIGFEHADLRSYVVFVLVALWGIRLTGNWASHWKGFTHEDWRYVDFRNQFGRWYWVISFLAIHLIPTVFVFLGCLALYPILIEPSASWNILDFVGMIILIIAILLELISDQQLHAFRRQRKSGEFISHGLWRYSRHPNYLGEILFWWGIYLFALAANPTYWWTIVGPVAMTLLFVFISIPLMEKHLVRNHPDFIQHKKQISMLIPLPPKQKPKRDATQPEN